MQLTLASALRNLSPVRRNMVLAVDVSQLADAPPCAVFTRIGEVEIDEALDLSQESEDERCLMQHRLNCGHWCIGGRVDEKLVFYAWLMFGEMEIGAHVVTIPSAYAYSYKAFTAQSFRRRGIASAYYAFLKRELSKGDRVLTTVASKPRTDLTREPSTREHLLATVAADNSPSLQLHARCGFSSFGDIWTVRGTERTLTTEGVSRLLEEADAARGRASILVEA